MKITEEQITGKFEGFTPFIISCKKGYIAGTYQHTENRISVSNTVCNNCLSKLIDYAVNKFNTNNILFYNIMNLSSWSNLRGFKQTVMIDPKFNEKVICLEGRWIKHG